jgi:hypothetical protein
VRVKVQTLKSRGKTAIGFESGGIDAIVPFLLAFFKKFDEVY